MNVRAVICDIYKTLLDVGPAPADAEERWRGLCRDIDGLENSPGLAEFEQRTKQVTAHEHAAARAAGIVAPEIFWPGVAQLAWPQLRSLSGGKLDDFLYAHAQLQRTLALMSGAGDALKAFAARGWLLGIASNSQPYTLHELAAALKTAGLRRDIFCPGVSFFSFEAGFSKPNPHAFRWLVARLAARGIAPHETLMIGDRRDNDIEPAQAQGIQTWQLLKTDGDGVTCGTWTELMRRLG